MLTRLAHAWRRRVWIHILRRFSPRVTVQIGSRRILVDVRDAVIGSLLYVEREYENTLEQLIDCLEIRGGACLDIGANIGLHTTLLSQLVGPSGQVFAFEPEPANSALLHRNLQLNNNTNVRQSESAIGDCEGTCRMRLSPSNFGDHRVANGTAESDSIEVPINTIDHLVGSLAPGIIKLIKIDVQGYELRVMRGMLETLRRNPAVVLIVEIFPEGLAQTGSSASELMQLFKDLGFQGWEVHDFRMIPLLEPWAYDLIRGGKYVDVVISRDSARLNRLLNQYLGETPAPCQDPIGKLVPSRTEIHA
jgi:FkbM family methyltransferase